MQITITADPKEIAALVLELQERQTKQYVIETAGRLDRQTVLSVLRGEGDGAEELTSAPIKVEITPPEIRFSDAVAALEKRSAKGSAGNSAAKDAVSASLADHLRTRRSAEDSGQEQ